MSDKVIETHNQMLKEKEESECKHAMKVLKEMLSATPTAVGSYTVTITHSRKEVHELLKEINNPNVIEEYTKDIN